MTAFTPRGSDPGASTDDRSRTDRRSDATDDRDAADGGGTAAADGGSAAAASETAADGGETAADGGDPAADSTQSGPAAAPLRRRTFLGGLTATGAGLFAGPASGQQTGPDGAPRQVEALDRGVVAVQTDAGVLVRWRLLGDDPDGVGFNLYRDGEQVNDAPITASTNYVDPEGSTGSSYSVAPVVDGTEQEASEPADVWQDNYRDIPLESPGDEYHPNDCSVGDLTGDGSYDVVVKWVGESYDNSQEGHTDPVIFDAYTLEGEHLWRIDLGINVRAGAHYTPFLVYDFDGDGIAEFVVRTADGTTDDAGTVIGDPDADWRNDAGRILEGPEYLTVFDGATGEELVTTDFEPARGDICDWGDCYGNRGDRFLAGVAYLDGERPSIVQARGYYEKTTLAAYDFRDGELSVRWRFDSDDGNEAYAGQGAHSLSVADVDGDGYDEIVYGAAVIDHDGTGLHSTGWHHGDALHVSDFVPWREGQEIFMPHESGPYGATMRDAETGEPLWTVENGDDVGRGVAGNIDPTRPGAQAWASSGVGLREGESGDRVADAPSSINSLVWWTGDLKRELLDGTWIDEWDPNAGSLSRVATFQGTESNNGTKANACLSGDLLGDWREEVLLRRDDDALRLFVTPHETEHRIPTLMHDTQYRTAIAWQNVAYNQPPHPSFFVGEEMELPPFDVQPVGSEGEYDPCEDAEPTSIDPYLRVDDGDAWSDWQNAGSVTIGAGSVVEFGPHPTQGGSWSWDGPGVSASSREIEVAPEETSTYTATHTNDCDVESTFEFTVTVEAGDACEAAGAEDSASVDGRTVCDVNGDGYYRDVTGDGSAGQTDVVTFFENQHRDAWKRPELFDFSGNGEVGHGDVIDLFEYVAMN